MNTYEDIKNFVSLSDGILFTEDFNNANITKYYINQLIEDDIIERYEKGIYLRNDAFEDEYYILQRKNPIVIYSFNTAMYLHHMTERTPINIDVTVYTGYNAQHLPKNVKVHSIKREIHNLGSIKVKTPQGFDVKAYNLERVTCDLITARNTGLDKEQTNKFLRMMFLENKLDTVRLMEYAKKWIVKGKLEILWSYSHD